jgi:arylsulfatase A-like enzyme
MPRPNILLIHSDQHRYDCLGVNGHALVQTPNLDRLAQKGVNFTSAYTPAPVCVPSRNSLQYGCWPTQHLAIANDGTEAPRPAREGLVSFSEALHEAGYHLTCVGKWQVHPRRSPLEFGYDRYIPDRDYRTWRATQKLPPEPHINGFWGEVDPGISPEQSALGWGASRVIDELTARAGCEQPFFLRWDTNEPHLPSILPEPYNSLITPESVAPWPSFPDSMVGKPYIQTQQKRSWKLDGWSWEQWAPLVARYLGVVSLLDTQVGRILAALQSLGLEEDTMVIYSTDHGDLCGGHGLIDKHYVMYEDVTHVPLIIRWPGHTQAGAHCDAFVSHALDLALTFCELADAAIPSTFRGHSLLPLLSGQSDNGRREIVSTYFGNQFGLYSQRMLRDRRYKYVWNLTAEDELYDLAQDPGELRNQAVNTEYHEILSGLRQRLLLWMEETCDPLLNIWTRTQLAENKKI